MHFCWKQSIKKGGVFKYPKVFQCDNGSEFKTTKYKKTHTVFVEAFNKLLAKLLFKPMDTQLQDLEKVSTIWVKILNKIVNKMDNTISSMTGMKS